MRGLGGGASCFFSGRRNLISGTSTGAASGVSTLSAVSSTSSRRPRRRRPRPGTSSDWRTVFTGTFPPSRVRQIGTGKSSPTTKSSCTTPSGRPSTCSVFSRRDFNLGGREGCDVVAGTARGRNVGMGKSPASTGAGVALDFALGFGLALARDLSGSTSGSEVCFARVCRRFADVSRVCVVSIVTGGSAAAAFVLGRVLWAESFGASTAATFASSIRVPAAFAVERLRLGFSSDVFDGTVVNSSFFFLGMRFPARTAAPNPTGPPAFQNTRQATRRGGWLGRKPRNLLRPE